MTDFLTADDFQQAARNDESHARYEADFNRFKKWCKQNKHKRKRGGGYTAAAVAEFIAYLAQNRKTSTIKRYVAEISAIHNERAWPNPCDSPTVRRTIKGVSKVYGNDREPKRALSWSDIKNIIDGIEPGAYLGAFQKAIVLLGFTSAMRRSEIVGIKLGNITWIEKNGRVTAMEILVTESKTGAFTRLVKASRSKKYCPVRAMQDLIEKRDRVKRYKNNEYVFASTRKNDASITSKTYGDLIKHLAINAGIITAEESGQVAGHSTRRGCITHLAQNNHSAPVIMALSGHRDYKTMLGYIENAKLYENTPRAAE